MLLWQVLPMRDEYDFDYSKTVRGKYYSRYNGDNDMKWTPVAKTYEPQAGHWLNVLGYDGRMRRIYLHIHWKLCYSISINQTVLICEYVTDNQGMHEKRIGRVLGFASTVPPNHDGSYA